MDYNLMTMKDDDFDGINDNSNYSSSDTINNNSNQRMNNPSGMSKAELRKSNKPIMEKRRRARINHCLNELKTLILEAMKKDPARHTKLEKADILEMTVKHLQSIQRQQLSLAIQTDPTVIHKFKTGFTECAEEVTRYIAQLEGVDAGVKQRLSNHLNNCSTGLEQLGTFSNFSSSYRTNSNTFGTPLNAPSPMFPLPQDVNNNGRIQMSGVQLIPSRLPSGELALIMPNTSSVPFFLPNMQPQALDFSNTFPRISAFSKPTSNLRSNVSHTATTTSSPPLSPVSSVSSLGDDSLHANLDSQSKTPPLQMSQSFSNAFPTPPSTESVKFISHTGHLQQPHVSSTSECSQLKGDLDDKKISKKRLCPDEVSICDEPASKVLKSDDIQNGNVADEASNAESTNDMWRPW